MLRYFERRASGQILDPSQRFLHQATGRVMGTCDSCGCELRSALKTLARFGAPPRRLWPDEVPLDSQPDAFVYAAATRFAPLYYTRLDDRCAPPEAALKSLRSFVAAGFAVVFGVPLFGAPTSDAEIALPTVFDFVRGGAAAVALGYDDARRLPAGKGALLVRMPWGHAWGERGVGWLPYGYVRERLAIDFWTLVKPEWLASGEFLRPV